MYRDVQTTAVSAGFQPIQWQSDISHESNFCEAVPDSCHLISKEVESSGDGRNDTRQSRQGSLQALHKVREDHLHRRRGVPTKIRELDRVDNPKRLRSEGTGSYGTLRAHATATRWPFGSPK